MAGSFPRVPPPVSPRGLAVGSAAPATAWAAAIGMISMIPLIAPVALGIAAPRTGWPRVARRGAVSATAHEEPLHAGPQAVAGTRRRWRRTGGRSPFRRSDYRSGGAGAGRVPRGRPPGGGLFLLPRLGLLGDRAPGPVCRHLSRSRGRSPL